MTGRITDKERDDIYRLRRRGAKISDIAVAAGRSESNIRYILAGFTANQRKRIRNEEILEKAMPMFEAGVTRKVMAARLEASHELLGRILPKTRDARKQTEAFHIKISKDLDERLGLAAGRFGATKQQYMRHLLEKALAEPAE